MPDMLQGPFDRGEIVPHRVSLVTRGPLPARPMGTNVNVGEAQRCYFGNHRTPIRCVGAAPFRNDRAIPKPTFRFTKHTLVGEIGTDCRRGGTDEHDVYSSTMRIRVFGVLLQFNIIMDRSWAISSCIATRMFFLKTNRPPRSACK